MSTYARVANGTLVTGFNTTLNPVPGTISAGNLLILTAYEYMGTDPVPTVTGWTLLSPGVNAKQISIWGRIATLSDAAAVTYGNQFVDAYINTYSGNPSTLTGIVHASTDKTSNNINSLVYNALTITAANCLVIAAAFRNKTAASNGATFGTFGSFTKQQSNTHSNVSIAGVYNDWIQTTATSISAGSQSYSISDSSSQQNQSIILALLPGTGGGGGGGGGSGKSRRGLTGVGH